MTCGRQCWGYRVPRSGLSLDEGDGVLHAPEHALLTPAEALALGGRQAARIQLPLAQDRELVRPRQLRMGHDVLGFGEEGSGCWSIASRSRSEAACIMVDPPASLCLPQAPERDVN